MALYGRGGQQGFFKALIVIFVASDLAAWICEVKTGKPEGTSTKTDVDSTKWHWD